MRSEKMNLPGLFMLMILLTGILYASNTPVTDFKWTVGEYLRYDVKWSFFYLGSLKLYVLEVDTVDHARVYHCKIHIDSNPKLPFVNIHDVYETYIDAEGLFSRRFVSYEQKSDHVIYTRYDFNYQQNTVSIRIENRYSDHTETVLDSVGKIPDKVQDSLSLLYFARAMVKYSINASVPVFAYNKLDTTVIRFTGDARTFDLHDLDLTGYYLDGRLKFVGIAGIKDDFKGWFSLDLQRVPLKAYMKAFVGSVRIELKEWENWSGEEVLSEN